MKNKIFRTLAAVMAAGLLSPILATDLPAPDKLEVVVKVDSGKAGLPKEGMTGVDVLIFKKGESAILARQTKNKKNDGLAIELPFDFQNPYAGLKDREELTMKVYGTTYNGNAPKLVGLKNQLLQKSDKKIILTLTLAPVEN